jgi:hypothetical protein
VNLFKSAGVVIESNGYYLIKNVNGTYDVLGGKIDEHDKTIYDTMIRECYEESDGLINLSDSVFIIKQYVIPEGRYMVYIINHKNYIYDQNQNKNRVFAKVKEGFLEWHTINEIKEIGSNKQERFTGILLNILTMNYDDYNKINPNPNDVALLVPEIYKNIPLDISYHTLNKIYDLHINKHDDLLLLVYKSDMKIWKHNIPQNKHRLLSENRGTIYHYNDNNGEYELVAFGLEKFWRHDDVNNSQVNLIDWNKDFKVQIKYDGFNYKVYYYKGLWHVSTNSSIDCKDVILRNSKLKAMDAFNDCIAAVNFTFDRLNKDYTYVFEMIHPDARLIVPYDKPSLIHLMTRDNSTLKEIEHDIGIPQPICIELKSHNEILKYVDNLSFEECGEKG